MIVQFFDHGTGGGSGPVDYVTSANGLVFDEFGKIAKNENKAITYDRDPLPSVISGDPDLIRKLIDSLDFKNKYTSGVLSHAPEDGILSSEKEAELIADFERIAFAGLQKDQYSILWVRHTHQNHHELHFVSPRVELSTGKSLNIAPPIKSRFENGNAFPASRKYFDAWRSLWNEREGWADPEDPARARLSRAPDHEDKITAANLRDRVKAEEKPRDLITNYLLGMIESGAVINRAGIVEALKEADLEINRQGKDYISVRPEPGAKPIRLKGVIYEQYFDIGQLSREIAEKSTTGERSARKPDDDRINKLIRGIEEAVNRRSDYNRDRYQQKVGHIAPEHRQSTGCSQGQIRDHESAVSSDLVSANSGRIEPLSWHLARELGPDAMDDTNNNKQSSRNPEATNDIEPIAVAWRIDNIVNLRPDPRTLHPDRRDQTIQQWIQSFKIKIGAIYDRVRKSIDGRIEQIIGAIRGGADAAATANRDLNEAGNAVEQASVELNQCLKRVGVIKMDRANELDSFKSRINLVEYAASQGYQIIKAESSRNSKIMELDGDKIIIATGSDGHGVYFSVRDDRDNGSIIDFIQRRQSLNLGQVRKELRQFSGATLTPTPALSKPAPSHKDTQQVIAVYSKTLSAIPSYLTDKRGIYEETIKDPRFSAVIRVDANQNAVFPHFNGNGLCGYELKNTDFTGFAKGGQKGVWHTSNVARAAKIIICESAIDALSHAQLHDDDQDTAYVSIGGSMNDNQPVLIKSLFSKAAGRGAEVVLALDNDDAGRRFVAQMHDIATETGVAISVDVPSGKDWNEQLIRSLQQERSRMSL